MGSPMRIAAALSDGPRGAIMLAPITRTSLSPTSLAASALARDPSRPLSAVKFVQVTEAGVEIPYVHPRSASSGSHAYPPTFSLPRVPGSAAANPNFRARSPRDSIISRQSPGRPGSRRHQRWMNEMQLKQPIEPDELRSLFLVTTESSFSFLWAGGGQAAKLMSDFLDITEEQQHEMLSASETSTKAPGTSRRRQIAGAAEKFVRLNCKARDLFRRGVGLNTLDDIEQRVIAFLSAKDGDRIDCEDMLTPMQRLVAHAVAEFHCCTSRTNSHPDGTRSMSIQKTASSLITQPTLMTIVTSLLSAEKAAAANAASAGPASRSKKKQREQRLLREACSIVKNPFSAKGVAAAEAAFASSVATVAAAAR